MERARGAGLEDLLAHSDWLTRLARRLTGGDDADDVVQEAWLAARRSPPDPDRPARPWLQGVLRNLVRARWQSDRRRRRREQAQLLLLPDREAAVDTLYERVELQRLVAERVMALDEPLRKVVLLRYFDGHDSTQIAGLLGIASGTVRWRLKQAIDQLRADMDARFHGNRHAWTLVLAPPAAAFPPPAAATTPQTTGSTIAAGAWTPFAAVVSGGLVLTLGVGLGIGAGVFSRRLGPRETRDDLAGTAREIDRSDLASLLAARSSKPGVPPQADRRPTVRAAVAALPSFRPHSARSTYLRELAPADAIGGIVIADGQPEDDAIVVATALDGSSSAGVSSSVHAGVIAAAGAERPGEPLARAKTADGGRFLLTPLRPGRYRLTASGHDRGSAHSAVIDLAPARPVNEVVLELRAASAGLAGRVIDGAGTGISRARVRARPFDPVGGTPLVYEAESGCLGRYHLDLAAGLYAFEVEAPDHPPVRFSLPVTTPLLRNLRLAPSPGAHP